MDKIPIRHINAVQEPNFSESFSIRNIHDILAGSDMVQELHRHDFFYILALKKGTGNHAIDFTSYEVCDNAVFLMRPGQVHQLTLRAQSEGYLMEFKSDFYYPGDKLSNQLFRKASCENYYRPRANGFEKLLAILNSIFLEFNNKQEQYLEVIKASLRIFFIELIRHRQHPEETSDQISPYTQERLEEFLELLETHVTNHKQVSHYADMLNLSPYQLNTITKATLGKTGSELITEYSILEAKRYLLATSSQITQIAYHLGYEDVSYFIRFFKKHTGHSPEAFRHNFR